MKKKIVKIAVGIVIVIIAIVVFQKVCREIDLRITGLKGEIVGKYYSYKDDPPYVKLHLAFEQMQNLQKEWVVTKSIDVKVKITPEVDEIREGQQVRVIKQDNGFWKIGRWY